MSKNKMFRESFLQIEDFFELKVDSWYIFREEKSQYEDYIKKTEKALKKLLHNTKYPFKINKDSLFIAINLHDPLGYNPATPSYMKVEFLFKCEGNAQIDEIEDFTTKLITDFLISRNLFVFSSNKIFI